MGLPEEIQQIDAKIRQAEQDIGNLEANLEEDVLNAARAAAEERRIQLLPVLSSKRNELDGLKAARDAMSRSLAA